MRVETGIRKEVTVDGKVNDGGSNEECFQRRRQRSVLLLGFRLRAVVRVIWRYSIDGAICLQLSRLDVRAEFSRPRCDLLLLARPDKPQCADIFFHSVAGH